MAPFGGQFLGSAIPLVISFVGDSITPDNAAPEKIEIILALAQAHVLEVPRAGVPALFTG